MSNDLAGASPALTEGLGPVPEADYATWYEASHYAAPTIKPVRVARETEHQIVLADCHRSNARRLKAGTYFKTWHEAHAYLLQVAERELVAARRTLQLAQSKHGNVKGMRPNVQGEGPPEPRSGGGDLQAQLAGGPSRPKGWGSR